MNQLSSSYYSHYPPNLIFNPPYQLNSILVPLKCLLQYSSLFISNQWFDLKSNCKHDTPTLLAL